ncbi:P-loop containing nucleoside triphosphate hydrolase protein [Choiromyces venosus 120613-1]|uniref:P-loop containing nucleoside triphosphate hydrolase protein n=1 Tax=Choiromyces venosus 120613-1 TaxID=1336337 RepID=A0A3N4K7I7_9PEZI|nr:P-loop containing nucleoside triphosphate hydrolase protein [Choiromyces venosus 120613-1]
MEAQNLAETVSSEDHEAETQNSWSSLFGFTLKWHFVVLLPALLFSVASGLVIPLMSLLMGRIFGSFSEYSSDKISSEELLVSVSRYTNYLLFLGVAAWFVSGSFFTSWLVFGELQARIAREELFEGVAGKDMEWFDTRKGIAGFVSGCQTQINELKNAVSEPFGFTVQASVVASVSLGIALYHSWSLTLVILSGAPIALVTLSFLSKRIEPFVKLQNEHLSSSANTVNKSYTAIETVKAFNAQGLELRNFSIALGKAARAYRSQANLVALQVGCIRFITFAMFVQGFWYGGVLVRRGKADAGDVMTTFWSCLMATQSFAMILPQMMLLQKGMAAGGSLKGLLRQVRDGRVPPRTGNIAPHILNGEIGFKNISFAYPSRPSQLALNRVDFSITAHETTFIIGRSGSGKSTIGNLLLKIYEPLYGEITIDGLPLNTLDQEWLRENITVVQQQSVLFNETIFRNIALGRKDYWNATEDQIRDACDMAMLEDAISELPLKYKTLAGVGGKQLSGGQRQRVALARAKLRDTEILILDEATSNLDYKTRSSVMGSIRRWRKGKTTIIITHDMAQIKPENFVYVFEDGRIVQSGVRSSLEGKNGPFQSFLKASYRETDDQKEDLEHIFLPGEASNRYDGGDESPPETSEDQEDIVEISNDIELVEPSSFRAAGTRKCSFSIAIKTQPPEAKPSLQASLSLLESSRKFRRVGEVKPSLYRIMATVWPSLTLGYRVLLIFGFIAAMLHGLSTPVFSFALARLLLSFFDTANPPSESRKWSLLVLAIAALDGINSYIMHYLLESCGQAWIDFVRTRAFSRILCQPLTWFDGNKVSSITEHLGKDAEEMRSLLGRFAGYAFVAVVMMAFGVGWSFLQSWELTFIGLAIAPVMYGITRGFSWVSGKWEEKSNDVTSGIGNIFEETVSNIRTVRALSLEEYFKGKYLRVARAAVRIGIRRAIYAGIGFGLTDSTILFASALVFYSGARLISKGLYNLEEIVTVFTLLLFCLANVNASVGSIPQISNRKDTATRVLNLTTLSTGSYDELNGTKTPDFTGPLVLENITFAYSSRPGIPIICDLNLTIQPGECVAIVGLSGSGKSTLTSLLQRFYLPLQGTIFLSDDTLSSLDLATLRSHISLVPQSPILFDTTIHENISYGGGYSRSEVESAARSAGIDEFIDGLPDGYDTCLTNGGSALSGGQAQRISIARALVRPCSLLIFDECTNNLDTRSARVVHESIKRLVEGKRKMTIIIITHSREMMLCAERIVVMSKGGIVEDGRFEELLKGEGELNRLLVRGELSGGNGEGGSDLV